ncbi:hypothetical protein K474DRAFT_1665915 [Panus rudis PR-1116 ss-1]|nr:hypothetical protein K474DRAFT_1665915 [Panus rudis PR-1116 ss-1]
MHTQPRTLVLCFDGTSNQFAGSNTNVVKFYSLLKKDDEREQLCYYQPGIGTYFQPGVVSPFFQWGAKILDEAVAWYLDAHVRGGYQFLMQNYHPGDKICIFGFSRGAYTARALAGMLHKIGLLPKDNPEQVPFAYKLYKKTDPDSLRIAERFKQSFCRNVDIEFVGVWDTVASVGVLRSKTLPFTTSNTIIKTFRHALSLDEHRCKFRPNLYHRPAPDAKSASRDPEHASPVTPTGTFLQSAAREERPKRNVLRKASRFTRKATKMAAPAVKEVLKDIEKGVEGAKNMLGITVKDAPNDEVAGGTDVLEVWFAGCHCDVGGGSVPDVEEHCLSNISLRWMVRQVVQAQCGIVFDREALQRANIPNSIFTGLGFPVTPPMKQSQLIEHFFPPTHQADSSPVPTPHSAHSVHTAPEPSSSSHRSPSPTGLGLSPFGSPSANRDFSGNELTPDHARFSTDHETMRPATLSDHRAPTPDRSADFLMDALSPINDQMQKSPMWWLIELMPFAHAYQDADGQWHKHFTINFGRGRKIPDIKPVFHKSVQDRMSNAHLKYHPRASWKEGTETYVE